MVTIHGWHHVLVVTPSQHLKLLKAAEALRGEADRLMAEFGAKASQVQTTITSKIVNGEVIIVDKGGLVDVPPGTN